MKPVLWIIASLALTGCASLGALGGSSPADQLAFLKEVNAHLDGCDRTYQGMTTPVPQLTVHIECKAKVSPPAATP